MGETIRIKDLPAPITASKADWLAGTTWIGFSPPAGDLTSRNNCSQTIQRQFGKGYIIEYITEQFSKPNPGFENDPDYLAECKVHEELAGRLIAVHRLRYSSRSLETIISPDAYKRLQDMWAQGEKRWRWSVAFPIIESYRIVGKPKAKDVLGEEAYRRLYAHASATLRPLNDAERATLDNLELERVNAENAWIALEDEFESAALSEIPKRIERLIERDLSAGALEGMTSERQAKVRRRAAWLAHRFAMGRAKDNALYCDDCGFDPKSCFPDGEIKLRSLLDVHHKHPFEEGVRYTTMSDFSLLCPTCHRVEHVRIRLATQSSHSTNMQ